MKKPLIILSAVLCMVLPSLSPAEMRQREPRQLAAAWQEVKKQIADDGKTIRVRDGIQALELLAELGISSVPADGVRLSRGSLTVGFPEGVKKRVQPVPFQQQALFHQTAQFPFREPFGLEPGQIFLGDVHQRTSLGRVFGRTVHAERDMGLRDFLHQFSQIFRIWYFRIVHRFCRINGCRHSASLSGVSRGSRWPA